MNDKFLIKSEEIPILKYGHYPGTRPMKDLINNGLIILDKWSGETSRSVVNTIKNIFSVKKTGHSGTLDPNVTGVLPITLGNACKVMPSLKDLEKEYVGKMKLHKDVSKKEIKKAVKKYTGRIKQVPPVRSAVARKERVREIYSFDILKIKGRDVSFRVSCQAGTYIRLLCHQVGKEIGGAHMTQLRRIRVGRFTEKHVVKKEDLVKALNEWKKNKNEQIREFVLPVEEAIEHIGKVIIKDSAVSSIVNGSPLYTAGLSRIQKNIKKDNLIAILTLKGELVALARSRMTSKEMLRHGVAARVERVIMDKGVYPKL